ncbi:methionyl-tRNA formyltransferase [Lacticaseibacillus pabuli]|uniref:Methionyl-tRNA formyltransferase n=1 Tax=Lacticaseibacillus pabuli TaxID=3025672 RepID=A0ABY7WW04_9LACO|nr:methionyl-tRNA formyltransferase [Lacticaseibacillus sp. KACC 23028]WDF83678.1 methionyl-tRNA formyltransferase [Lacticaseibacillus sp. KACC 23028]
MTSIIFMGTPEFAVPVLDGLVDAGYDVQLVITQPDRKVGRKQVLQQTPVKEAAVRHNIKVLQPEKLSGSPELDEAMALNADLIVTAAYGQFLPTKFLKSVKITAVNVHGSLLPKYRGGAPIQYSIINGDHKTGVTIIQMVKKMDAGVMYAQQSISLTRDDDTGTVFQRLSPVGRDLLLATLPKIIDGTAVGTQQPEDEVTFSPNISKAQEHLDFTLNARQIDQWVRGLRPHVGGWVDLGGKRTKLWAVTPLDEGTDQTPGTLIRSDKHEFVLAAGDGTVLSIDELQPAGKAKQDITQFMNGQGRKFQTGDQVIIDGE